MSRTSAAAGPAVPHATAVQPSAAAPQATADEAAAKAPVRVQPRLAVYQNVNEHSPCLRTARRRTECLALVTTLGGRIDVARDVYVDNVSDSRRTATGFHPAMEQMLVAAASGRYDGVVMWQLPWHFTNPVTRATFQRVMVEAACELYVVTSPHLSLYGPVGLLFGL
jgi:hypothetical protein